MSNSNYENLHYYAGATSEFDKPRPYIRSQRSKQVRWGLIGLSTLALAGGAYLSGTCLYQQHLNDRQILQVQLLAQQIDSYHPQIESELTDATQFAKQIGNQVADDGALDRFNNVATAAQSVLNAEAPWPVIGTKPAEVLKQREIAEGMLAVNTALQTNFEQAEAALTKSHDAWLVEQARIPAQAAAEALQQPIATAQTVLVASEGIVNDGDRATLQSAIDDANKAISQANREYKTAEQYTAAQADCEQAESHLAAQSRRVFNLIPVHPEFIVVVDEEGNESQIPNPDYIPPVYIEGLSPKPDADTAADGAQPESAPAPAEATEPIRG